MTFLGWYSSLEAQLVSRSLIKLTKVYFPGGDPVSENVPFVSPFPAQSNRRLYFCTSIVRESPYFDKKWSLIPEKRGLYLVPIREFNLVGPHLATLARSRYQTGPGFLSPMPQTRVPSLPGRDSKSGDEKPNNYMKKIMSIGCETW